eukprot:scaffold24048_cov194-Amphora_coffeaeformis.AAC.7
MIPSRRRRRRPISSSKRGGTGAATTPFQATHAVALAVGFCSVWGLALWYTHASLGQVQNNINNNNNNNNDHVAMSLRGPPSSQQQQQQQQLQPPAVVVAVHDPNPYFGWQPPIIVPPSTTTTKCSWRDCFQKDHSSCATTKCRDDPLALGPAPPPVVVNNNDATEWIPDVTVLARMRRLGYDAVGNPWPPPLDAELCQPMGPMGGTNDVNKECT